MKGKVKRQSVLLLLGCTLLALATWYTCSDKSSPTSSHDETVYSETPAMTSLSDSLITSFKAGDKARVLALVRDEQRAVCTAELNGDQYTLEDVGQAMEKRKLVFASALYAEYEVTLNGQKYCIAYGQCGDGHWQLMRF
jgi:hypothetical protein